MSHASHRLLVLAAISTLAVAGCASHPQKQADAAAQPASGTAEADTAAQGQAKPLPDAPADKGAAAPAEASAAAADSTGAGDGSAAATQVADASGGADPKGNPAPAAAKAKPAAPAAAKPSVSPADLATLEDLMKHYPRVLWHSHDNTYQFYVGTVLFARYDPYKDVFTISTDNADHKDMVCTHQPDGGWKVDGKVAGTSCDTLLHKLDGYLQE